MASLPHRHAANRGHVGQLSDAVDNPREFSNFFYADGRYIANARQQLQEVVEALKK